VPAVTTLSAICLGAIALGALLLLGAVRSVVRRRMEGDSQWPALWMLVPALALVILGSLFLARDRRHTQAAERAAKAVELKDKGLPERARREAERALKLDPENAQAERTLRDLQEEEKEREEAERRRALAAAGGGGGGGSGRPPKPRDQPRTGIAIEDYHLAATLLPELYQLKATATITARPRDLDARELTFLLSPSLMVSSIQVDGETASFKFDEDRLIIALPDPVPSDRPLKIVIAYRGFGHDAVVPGGDRIADDGCYLRPEAQWYPSTHYFEFSAPVTLAVTVPADMTAIGPGTLQKRTRSGDEVTFVWRSELPIRAIVTAAARYKQQRRQWRGVTVSVCTFPQHIARAARYFPPMIGMLEYFSEQFGPYPFKKFALVEIPYFPGGYGAPSFVMCRDKIIDRDDVDESFIAHEIAHQWWGHAVTRSPTSGGGTP